MEITVEIRKETKENEQNEEIRKAQSQAIIKRTNDLFEIIGMGVSDYEVCRQEIIELNIKLVTHVLKKYMPFTEDDFQTGCVGLIIATNTFNPARKVPFASYACFCIERELHKAHKAQVNSFEYRMYGSISSLDELINLDNGDGMDMHETIADGLSEEVFEKILTDFDLENLFDEIILPVIDSVAGNTRGQASTVDFDTWRKLELRYLLEMAEIDSQKSRVTLQAMAKELGVSIQNMRMRHQRVIENIKIECIKHGIEV